MDVENNIVEDDVLVVDIELETGNDLLKECAGGCRQKILTFFGSSENWGENVEASYCLDCRARLLASGSVK